MYTRQLARKVLSQAQTGRAARFVQDQTILNHRAMFCSIATEQPVADAVETDIVRNAVEELLCQRDAVDASAKAGADLERSYQHFQYQLQEARSCISDIADCEDSQQGDHLQEEVDHAAQAVEETFAAYLDLLDESRGSKEEPTKELGTFREKGATELKALRKELDSILQQQEQKSNA